MSVMADGQIVNVESHGETDQADIAMCKDIFEQLSAHYPGHPWCIGANSFSGAVDIKLLYNGPDQPIMKFGYSLNIGGLDSDSGRRKVMRAGGELLERYGLARAGFRDGDVHRARDHGLDLSR